MSAAAEELAKACTHAKVKGSRRALLDTIAKLIPEGQTMTPPIALEELARLAGYYEMTFRQARDVLVTVGVLRIVGGGRGRPASYELLALPGAGDDPALPLIGAAPRRSRATQGPDLFDPPRSDQFPDTVRGDDIGTKYRTPRSQFGRKYRTAREKFGTFYRTCRRIVSEFGTFYRTRVTNVGRKYRTARQVLDVDDARARDVHTFTEVHTHPPPAGVGREPPARRPCPSAKAHAWCDGRVHVPHVMHAHLMRLHGRLPGEGDHDVERRLFAFYADTCAALPPEQSIGPDEIRFWRGAYAAVFDVTPRAAASPPRSQRGPAPAFPFTCPHTPPHTDPDACIDQQAADFAERQRKSG